MLIKVLSCIKFVKPSSLFHSGQINFANKINSETLKSIKKVKIDPNGSFKYCLVKVYEDENNLNSSVTIVRGTKLCSNHTDILEAVRNELDPLPCQCIGGGKIQHLPDDSKIKVHGTSQFGRADHFVAAKIIEKEYPKYIISVSDEE